MTNTTIVPAPDVLMHVALDTADLAAAIGFYSRVFGRPPAKQKADWAKFELEVPPLVFSLNQVAQPKPQGRLSHLGVRVASHAILDDLRARLLAGGVAMQEEAGTTCCYAQQDKVWVTDPDGNAWEFYVLLADVDAPSSANQPAAACSTKAPSAKMECCVPRR